MLKTGLLGRKLGHSYSPPIHKMLGDYEYELYEREEEDVGKFLKESGLDGMNVTIPYKKTVIPYLDEVSETVKMTGSANTVVKRKDGSLYGDNTDVYGFTESVRHSGIDVGGKKTLVLGNGGAAASIKVALEKLNAETVVISRSGENNYENLHKHYDAEVIVNTTPLGMFPKNGESPLELALFRSCSGVIDIIYNPTRTALLLRAEELGIPHTNGLYMLVAQAKRSSELFTNTRIPDSETDRIFRTLELSMQNIILIGMPGSGKSTVAKKIAELTGREMIDTDDEITKETGKTPAQIITSCGEKAFRETESRVIAQIGKRSGCVIATGGGAVTREENYKPLHQNGYLIWLRRNGAELPSDDRPLSQKYGVQKLYEQREPMYKRFADAAVDISSDENISVDAVLRAFSTQEAKNQ